MTSVILTLTFSMDLNSVIGNNLKFHDDTMMGLEHGEKDGTEGQTVAAKNHLAGNELRSLPESGHYYSPVPQKSCNAFSQTILSSSQIPKVYL